MGPKFPTNLLSDLSSLTQSTSAIISSPDVQFLKVTLTQALVTRAGGPLRLKTHPGLTETGPGHASTEPFQQNTG